MTLQRSFVLASALACLWVSSGLATGTQCTMENIRNLLSTRCGSLSANATVLSITHISSNGSFGIPMSVDGLTPQLSTDLPDLCAVHVNVTTSKTSSYTLALFLPSEWNYRFLATGGGGAAGYINYLDMGASSHYGFATMSTDNGHNSSAFDLSWAYKNPEGLEDWGWRAMHGSIELSKDLIAAYYEKQIEYSYYTGCSTGGRQGLKEAQLRADSFDGMLIGAAAWWSTHLLSWMTKISKNFYAAVDVESIPSNMFPLIASIVTEQCDGLDGMDDGIISDPDLCAPNFGVLSCGNSTMNSSMCLTDTQLDTLAKIYSNYTTDSKLAYPGLELSSEPEWKTYLFGGQPNPFGIDFMRFAVFNDPHWPLDDYNDGVLDLITTLDPGNATADDYDMSAYRDRGGRILMYHGLSDGLIPTKSSPYFYEQVASATGAAYPITDWFRLFLVPGMLHCSATTVGAPWYFNGAGQASAINSSAYSVPGFQDSRHDALLALMDWVENGKTVDQIIATGWKNMTDLSQGVSRQRPLCPYPRIAKYNGQGNADEAKSWTCQ